MIKLHHKLLILSTTVFILSVATWKSSESSIKIIVTPRTIPASSNSVSVTPSSIDVTSNIIDITEIPQKIQNFPLLLGRSTEYKSLQNFNTERFFARIYELKIKPKVISSKTKENIIRISNIPVNKGHLSSKYGIRKDPFHSSLRMHHGIDIAAEYGSIVTPLGKGKVVFAGHKAGYGNTVEIKHGNTVLTRYAHLKQFLVNEGQKVTIKDSIGLVGSTGRSTGPHLHLEILFNGKQSDPQKFLANHFGSRPGSYQVVQTKEERKIVKKTAVNKVASKESLQDRSFPQVSYQDYVNSVNGMFGLSAPDSFSQ